VLNPAISHRSQSLVIPPNRHPIRLVAGKFSHQSSVISHQSSVISHQLFSPLSPNPQPPTPNPQNPGW
jgi:hypothetical protein